MCNVNKRTDTGRRSDSVTEYTCPWRKTKYYRRKVTDVVPHLSVPEGKHRHLNGSDTVRVSGPVRLGRFVTTHDPPLRRRKDKGFGPLTPALPLSDGSR